MNVIALKSKKHPSKDVYLLVEGNPGISAMEIGNVAIDTSRIYEIEIRGVIRLFPVGILSSILKIIKAVPGVARDVLYLRAGDRAAVVEGLKVLQSRGAIAECMVGGGGRFYLGGQIPKGLRPTYATPNPLTVRYIEPIETPKTKPRSLTRYPLASTLAPPSISPLARIHPRNQALKTLR